MFFLCQLFKFSSFTRLFSRILSANKTMLEELFPDFIDTDTTNSGLVKNVTNTNHTSIHFYQESKSHDNVETAGKGAPVWG